MLGRFIFTAEQPIRGFGSRTHHYIRIIHRHAGENGHSVRSFGVDIASRFHEIFRTQDADVFHSLYLVHVMISGIDHGNGHALSLKSGLMQFFAVTDFYLPEGRTVVVLTLERTVRQGVPFIFRCRFRRGNPYLLGSTHKRQCGNFAYHGTVVT